MSAEKLKVIWGWSRGGLVLELSLRVKESSPLHILPISAVLSLSTVKGLSHLLGGLPFSRSLCFWRFQSYVCLQLTGAQPCHEDILVH